MTTDAERDEKTLATRNSFLPLQLSKGRQRFLLSTDCDHLGAVELRSEVDVEIVALFLGSMNLLPITPSDAPPLRVHDLPGGAIVCCKYLQYEEGPLSPEYPDTIVTRAVYRAPKSYPYYDITLVIVAANAGELFVRCVEEEV